MKKFLSAVLSVVMFAAIPISANAYEITDEETGAALKQEAIGASLSDKALSDKLAINEAMSALENEPDAKSNVYEPSGAVIDTEPAAARKSIAIGDADGDTKITSSDALMILRTSVGLDNIPKEIGDIDSDGKINSLDSLIVLRQSVGFKDSDRIGIMVDVDIIEPTSISLSQTALTLDAGNSVTLKATLSPFDTTYKTVVWTSNNTNVATVSGGTVTGVNQGTAIIAAYTSNGKTALCRVTVNKPSETENCRRLISYINSNYTLTSEKGYKGITMDIVDGVTVNVLYDHNNDNIVFYSSLDNNNVYGIDVDDGTQIVYDYKNGNVSQETVVIARDQFGFLAKANFKAAEIKKEQSLTYTLSNTYGINGHTDDAQSIANSYRDITLTGAQIIIRNYMGLEFSDIGFKNYI